jgi:hypothetical protein
VRFRGLLAGVVALASIPARAQDAGPESADGGAESALPTDAEIAHSHFVVGNEYFSAGRYAEAARELLEAYRLSKKVDILYDIARCYDHLDDPGRMTTYYMKYLAGRPDAPDREKIEDTLMRIAPRVANLAIQAPPDGTEIFVDGERIGRTPIVPLTLTEGKHKVEARFAEFPPTVRTVQAPGGKTTEVRLEPKKLLLADPGEARRRKLYLGIGLAGAALAVVAGVLGAVFGALAARTDYADNARRSCSGPTCTLVDLQ